ncbi:MAG: UDP-N-acetylmuramyl pentapeptide phosphotransferase/UDP-N-acetylglucosamine-1-phosphate transferase [Candidatus Moranbacteria bacterium GW2011_GWF2_34_56]|nr:MAG: UDP-N-acetylmuramyl pentapeptide phosphotransferase/UDP-N-acetylglucosamine-1-phosphate transferase [Candidatus Moranbacteria bacterium GW2011_GWF1_34_10]KKP64780.1 MAG: UDP-N-acetylmuramyl pentapeptide phosphotransferase/UDP-N-acetylglucosamine-1-phosphate transferase [Candidatus Moranbacteria bacterium GW2011_GWF2_34_56]HBI16847.1 hypothetical protein [Candidatus Moranbacteria bacterium]
MILDLYLIPFLQAFFISVILILIIRYLSAKFFVADKNTRKGNRHIHNNKISRWGGVGIVLSFLIVVFLDKNLVLTKDIFGIIVGGLIIFGLGIWDDLKEVGWKKQLFFQSIAIILIFVCGVKMYTVSNPFGDIISLDSTFKILIGILAAVVWSLVLINSMNWLDGMDGLSMGVYFIGALAMLFLSLKPEVNQPPVGIISMALAGAILGFLTFNFPPAKIMVGSNGIFFVGFIVAGLSIFAGTKIATTLLVLFIPLVDFFWVIFKRLRNGKSIFAADSEHLHYKLMKIGWSHWQINIFFYSITAAVAFTALNASGLEKIFIMFCLLFLTLAFYWFISKKEQALG